MTADEANKQAIKVKGYINVPKGGFKLNSTILYFKLKDIEAIAIDKKRIKEIEFEIEEKEK